MELTIGEQRVRTTLNPNHENLNLVDEIKQKTAELINLCEELKKYDVRAASVAQTEYQTACFWAVNAATA